VIKCTLGYFIIIENTLSLSAVPWYAEPAEVGITILCGPKRTPEEVKARQMQLMQ